MKDKELYSLEVMNMQYELIENLHKTRLKQRLTQEDIAQKTGLSQQAISRIETFQYSPSLTTLLKYLNALEININDLFHCNY